MKKKIDDKKKDHIKSEETKKKRVSKDVGEYVDYEEVKEP